MSAWAGVAIVLGTSVLADAKAVSVLGISEKHSAAYLRLSERARRDLETTRDSFIGLNLGEISPEKMRTEFATYCLDEDAADLVSWKTSPDRANMKVSFSCVFEGEQPRIRERLFVFTYEKSVLTDIQVVSADLDETLKNNPASMAVKDRDSFFKTGTGKVVVAVSGSMLKSGASAWRARSESTPVAVDYRDAGKGALVAGLSAAVGNFLFDTKPEASGLAGGALTIALNQIEAARDPSTGLPVAGSRARSDASGTNVIPLSIHLTFKFH